LQNHIMQPGGHRVLRGVEITLGMFARTASPVGSVINVWEFA
jgi:hypothetical protein